MLIDMKIIEDDKTQKSDEDKRTLKKQEIILQCIKKISLKIIDQNKVLAGGVTAAGTAAGAAAGAGIGWMTAYTAQGFWH